MKKVAVIFNGGTISMKFDNKIKAAVPALSGEEIMSKVKGIEKFAKVESFNFSELPGPHVTPSKMLELSKFIKDILKREDIAGAVVTHGTDSLEETAYFLDLTIKSEKPVVVTGSMRNSSELGYDGPRNLLDSICTAISDDARNKGVLVCFNDELNSASEATKVHSMHLNAFESPDFGPLGIIDSNRPIFYRDRACNEYIETDKIEEKVALIKTAAGMNSDFINFAAQSGYKGIVIEGMGSGNLPPLMVDGVKKAVEKSIPIVLVSRCYKGRVIDSYGDRGGGKELRDLGVIFGDNLPGQKARIKLILALGKTKDINEIRKIFEEDFYRIYK